MPKYVHFSLLEWAKISDGHISNTNIDVPTFLSSQTSMFLKRVSREQLEFDPSQLLDTLKYLGNARSVDLNGPLDAAFNTIVDDKLDASMVVDLINRNQGLTPFIIDSLKREHALADIQSILPLCVELKGKFNTTKLADEFVDLLNTITTRTFLIAAIESLSLESQRFFGTFIHKNNLPIPLSYYSSDTCDSAFYKVNFNCLIEVLCLSADRVYIQVGSDNCVGFGKTSIIPFIFNDKRSSLLSNKNEDSIYRSSCIDVIFGSINNSSYVIFDVHGHLDDEQTLSLVYAIQLYATIQVLFVTPNDLKDDKGFFKLMIRTELQIPTIVCIFNEKFDQETSTTERDEEILINKFQTYAEENQWENNIEWMIVPKMALPTPLTQHRINRRSTRLIGKFSLLFRELENSMKNRPLFRSIFAIQSAYLINRTNPQHEVRPRIVKFQVEDQLRQLFERLSDRTENLKIITPISYFRSQTDLIRKHLAEIVDLTGESEQLAKNLKQIETERRKYKTLSPYMEFIMNLLQNCPHVYLIIAKSYLEKWGSQYTPTLKDEREKLKKEASDCKRKLLIEEQKHPNETNSTIKQLRQQLNHIKCQINDKDAQLANVDISVGLIIDELFALYDYLRDEQPILFEEHKNNFKQVANKLAQLVYRGFAIHILRNRPLLYQSSLMEMCLKQLRTIDGGPLAVLTVIGEQSSAKSSLLNTTFGCNFHVSAGRCTIGMYLGVAYYKTMTIVILDTEGLLSLEESGSIFDNQMVTMAVLSSHIVLINHKGELSSSLEGLIGMSLYAKLQIQSASFKPKLMFVLRDQIDRRNDVFSEQLSKLRTNLQTSSNFLGVSVDNELEMNDKNLILLPSAFSEDINVELNLKQKWRNQTFPDEIQKLRSRIWNGLDEQIQMKDSIYKNFDYLYKKIGTNWNSIDALGQGLLACKTLCELSITNELKEIAKGIIREKSEKLLKNGRDMLKELMVIRQNQTQLNPDIYMKQVIERGIQNLDNLTTDCVHEAKNQFTSSTEQARFTGLRDNIGKNIEPSIRCNQQILREQFEIDIYTVARESATTQVQNELLKSAKAFFEREIREDIDAHELNQALEIKHKELKNEFERSLDLMRRTQQDIIQTILHNYNTLVRSRRANANKNDIYNRCPTFDPASYSDKCISLDKMFQTISQYLSSKQNDSSFWGKLFKRSKSLEDNSQDCSGWFCDHRDNQNRVIFENILEYVIPELNCKLVTMLSGIKRAYSDPKTINDLVDYVDNSMNGQQSCIQKYYRSINLPQITGDLIFIALRLLIDEAIRISETEHNEMRKAVSGLEKWKNDIKEQFLFIRDSDQQAQKFADDFLNQLFDEIVGIFKESVHTEIGLRISQNSHIDPEKIARNAYDNSIGSNPPNGDSIIKYVLDINRYYLELALQSVELSAQHIVASQILKLQKIGNDAINKAVDVVQTHVCLNVQEVYQSIIQALQAIIPDFKTENLVGISAKIQEPEQFRQRFIRISNQRDALSQRIANQQKEFDEEATRVCRSVITQRLGCQACCPGCGTKCDNTELDHDKHQSAHHIAMAFKGWRYIDTRYPALELCYQQWNNDNFLVVGDEKFFPRYTYYQQRAEQWFDDINEKAKSGDMHEMNMPPLDQRRAWMVVRKTLVHHYKIVDHPSYDNQYYPASINSLPADYKPKWTCLN